jgi:hypothetical protein
MNFELGIKNFGSEAIALVGLSHGDGFAKSHKKYTKIAAAISLFIFHFSLFTPTSQAQLYASSDFDKKYTALLSNPAVQIEATEAINKLYGFKFAEADVEFRWLKYRYPNHPMPYFLMGLAEWWKIVPNTEDDRYDDRCLALMDTCISIAEKLYDSKDDKTEASFFYRRRMLSKGGFTLSANTGLGQRWQEKMHSNTYKEAKAQ